MKLLRFLESAVMFISNLYFGFHVSFENCTFDSNQAQFGPVVDCISIVSSPAILNFTNCVAIKNEASKSNTYLGVDYSQGGVLAGNGFGGTTYIYLKNMVFGMNHSPKGSIKMILIKRFVF